MQRKWYVLDAGVELGPFDQAQIIAMAKSGRISPSDFLRSDSMESAVVASSLKGLFPVATEPGATNSQPQPSDAPMTLRQAGDALGGLARLKTIELQELPQADFDLGKKALEMGFSSPKTAEILLAIRDLEEQVKQLRSAGSAVNEHATLADRAGGIAQVVKTKVSIESLIQRRKRKVIELGSTIRMYPRERDTQALSGELKKATALCRELEKLREATRHSRPLKKLKRYSIAAAVLLLLVGGLWQMRGTFLAASEKPTYRSTSGLSGDSASGSDSRDEPTQYELDMRARELELEARRQKLAEEKARKQAEQEMALKEKALRDEEAKIAAAEAEAAERKKEEARKAIEAERLAKEAERLRIESEREAAIAQETRKQLAESLFEPLSLDPSRYISLSSKLTAMGVTVEIRGERVPQIKTLLESKDYLGLIKFFQNTEVTEYPAAEVINAVHKQLLREPFTILVKSDKPLKVDRRNYHLLHVRFLEPSNTSIVNVDYTWSVHPDGIGYLGEWELSYGPSILCYGDSYQYISALRTMQSGISKTLQGLQSKQSLGELSQEIVDQRRKELVIEAQSKVRISSLAL